MYKKILIANRGEIACRIARTLSRMGIAAATVHSTADARALHVLEIGESTWIGEGPARQSYLDVEAVVQAGLACGADAVHPGFGFLSEHAGFARRCAEAGLAFIGPRPETLELFGDKATAKRLAVQLGIATAGGATTAGGTTAGVATAGATRTPATDVSDDVDQVLAILARLPLPCVVKAVAGGGGKGMRVVRDPGQAREAIEAAIREGRSSFGDGRVLVERYLERPRHIEIQILGDGQGGVIHLHERECSLQRRYQKVVEEAPVLSLPEAMLARLRADALALGRAANYLGLGTVEFAVVEGEAAFLEVNPRLQVEHPVTEAVLGLDLVELQIRTVAEGRLALSQDEVPTPRGHAIEARLYAEDAAHGFLPSTGRITALRVGAGVRADLGVAVGSEISPHYDPMIAKLIAHEASRGQALDRLREATLETQVHGVTSNRGFLAELLASASVRANAVDTQTIDRWLLDAAGRSGTAGQVAAVMAAWRAQLRNRLRRTAAGPRGTWFEPGLTGWRLGRQAMAAFATDEPIPRYQVVTSGATWRVGFGPTGSDGRWMVAVDDQRIAVRVQAGLDCGDSLVEQGGRTWRVALTDAGGGGDSGGGGGEGGGEDVGKESRAGEGEVWASLGNEQLVLQITALAATRGGADQAGAGAILAPMMGLVIGVHVEAGREVAAGDRLATLESMKMEITIEAPVAGTVTWVGCEVGGKVERNQEMIRISDGA